MHKNRNNPMDNQTEPKTLREAITRITEGNEKPFAICQYLADKVADLMQHEDTRAESCLQFIADTYEYTSCKAVRLAIENCFLYRLGTRIFTSDKRSKLLKLLPRNLHDMLMRQMTVTGL